MAKKKKKKEVVPVKEKRTMTPQAEREKRLEDIRQCVVTWLDEHNGVSISRREISACSGVGSTGIVNLYVQKLIDAGALTIVGDKADARTLTLPNATFIIPWNDREGVSTMDVINQCDHVFFDGDYPDEINSDDRIKTILSTERVVSLHSFLLRLDEVRERNASLREVVLFAHRKDTAALAAALGCAVIRY